MKSYSKIFIVLGMSLLVLSCKKQGCTDEFALNYDVNAKIENDNFCRYAMPEVKRYVPNYGANTATLAAINKGKTPHYWKIGTKYSWSYTLAAKFQGNNGEYQSAGLVSFWQRIPSPYYFGFYFEELAILSDNSYVKNGTVAPPSVVFSFLDTVVWKASGNTWPAFELFTTIGTPSEREIISSDPSIESSYNFRVSTESNGDSLVFDIFGQRNHISKVIHASESSHLFSQQEIESLGKGDAVLQVVSVNYDVQTENGKTYHFLNQSRSLKEVFIE
ncbi:hypothetical protein [Brumimicrobium mesophilum]|uniref:hypothetical protein n=1 Tax=Brumimicrobium mesophilum TaxID=392717 RepID=UPI000D14443C|nr:hypothetical protein [Brumimicrobium mesophilum]